MHVKSACIRQYDLVGLAVMLSGFVYQNRCQYGTLAQGDPAYLAWRHGCTFITRKKGQQLFVTAFLEEQQNLCLCIGIVQLLQKLQPEL